MIGLQYIWSKALKKLRGRAVRKSLIHPSAKIEAGSSFLRSDIGRHSFCGYNCEISFASIGHFTSIANHVAIGGGRHPLEWAGMSPVFYEGRDSVKKKFSNFPRPEPKKVIIGSDVWIGYRAIIMQGVTVGHGAVIGAGSVVTRDVPPYAIVAGVPAREVGYRFNEEIKETLLASRWWERSDRVLDRVAEHIRDPETFLIRLSKCE